jgi:predicted GIY-YIG superfamily endonuclease
MPAAPKVRPQTHSCYLLKSTVLKRTYIGYTVNVTQRLRKHNGEIKGGAKYTSTGRPWVIVCHVTGFATNREALRFEWHWKNWRKSKRVKQCIDPAVMAGIPKEGNNVAVRLAVAHHLVAASAAWTLGHHSLKINL